MAADTMQRQTDCAEVSVSGLSANHVQHWTTSWMTRKTRSTAETHSTITQMLRQMCVIHATLQPTMSKHNITAVNNNNNNRFTPFVRDYPVPL